MPFGVCAGHGVGFKMIYRISPYKDAYHLEFMYFTVTMDEVQYRLALISHQ